jgi:hypothetical protein
MHANSEQTPARAAASGKKSINTWHGAAEGAAHGHSKQTASGVEDGKQIGSSKAAANGLKAKVALKQSLARRLLRFEEKLSAADSLEATLSCSKWAPPVLNLINFLKRLIS